MKTKIFALIGLLCLFMYGFNSFAQQEFVLNEEYNNNYNSWTEQSDKEAKSKIRDGKYICDINSGIFFLNQLITVNLNSSKDFVIESTMTKKSGDIAFGITWGADGNGGRYNFVINSSGTYSIHKWTNYAVSFSASSISTSAIKADYLPNKLSIKKEGRTLKFYVNDTYLQDLPFETFFGQKFGFYANSGEMNIEVENFKIYYTNNSNTSMYSGQSAKGEEVVLNEEYNNNYNNWTEQSDKEAKSQIRDGKYICNISSGIFFLDQLITVNLNPSRDFIIECTMTKKSGDISYGISWGADGIGSRFNFVINSSGTYSIHKWTSYVVSFYANTISSYAIKADYSPNKLSIKKEGGTLKFYVNDTYLQDLPFEPFFGQKFGFYANSGELNVEIDNYKIYYPATTANKSQATTSNTNLGIPTKYTDVGIMLYDFLETFDHNTTATHEYRKKFLAPSYMNDKGLYAVKYKVNNYTIYGHSNESFNPTTGTINALIWGQDRSWIKRLVFTIIKENGYFYIYPSSISSMDYIEPWTSMVNDVSVTTNNTVDFKEGKKVVSGFLDAIKTGNSSTDIFIKSFLSPKYLLNGGYYDPKYKVNTYSLYGYEIESSDAISGKVIAKIWGQDKGWIHRLYFNVIKEDGNYYLSPSKVSESFYIYPWESADTYIK